MQPKNQNAIPDELSKSYSIVTGSSLELAHSHLEELEKFLFVCAEMKESSAPSKRIDEIWHQFILCTEPYSKYCDSKFGCYIHHNPTGKPEVSAYTQTRLAAKARYGELNDEYWPVPNQETSGTCLDIIGTCLDN